MKYSYIIGDGSATLINLLTGSNVTLMKNDGAYSKFLSLIKEGKFLEAETAGDVVSKISAFVGCANSGGISINVKDSAVTYTFNGQGPFPLHNAIVDRIIKMADDGFDVGPLMKFLANLLNNPDKTSIDELYMFLEASALPITEDGCFIAYKIVKNDYMDIYSGTTRNKIGDTPSMPRFEVDTNRHNTCSRGLHFCSKTYLPHYGTQRAGGDRCMLVKVNPADVVSIPSDYNNAKGRAWKYEVVGEMNATEWRKMLANADFTAASVVSPTAQPTVVITHAPKVFPSVEVVFHENFYVDDDGEVRWFDTDNKAKIDHVISRVMKLAGVSEEEADEFVFRIRCDEGTKYDPTADFFATVQVDTAADVLDAVDDDAAWNTVTSYGFKYDYANDQWLDVFGIDPFAVSIARVSDVTGLSISTLQDLTD